MGLTLTRPLSNAPSDDDIELLRETKLFAAWSLEEVEALSERFHKRFGFAITFAQFEELLLLKNNQLSEDVSAVSNRQIFDVLDRNRDGRIDGLEFLAALTCCCRATFERKVRFAFELFDFNQNGSLSLTELSLLLKSVWVGMRLFTGGNVLDTDSDDSNNNMMDQTTPVPVDHFLQFSEAAFRRFDKDAQKEPLNYEEFVDWSRSNREFMLQVEHFRLVCEKALNAEEETSILSSSDIDSDLDNEADLVASSLHENNLSGNSQRESTKTTTKRLYSCTTDHPVSSSSSMLVPSWLTPPSLNVDLDWVYGTRTHECRGSARFLASGEVVYFASKHAIVYNATYHHQRFYEGHLTAITALDVNRSGELVATSDSGVRPQIHVWHGSTLQCLAILKNSHTDGIDHVRFSSAAVTMHGASMERASSANDSTTASSSVPHERDLILTIGSDAQGLLVLWDWKKETIVASGRAFTGPRCDANNRNSNQQDLSVLAKTRIVYGCALSETGHEAVICGAHFVLFHVLDGQELKLRKPKFNARLITKPLFTCAAYYASNGVVVGAKNGVLYQFVDRQLVRSIQAHSVGESVNVCFVACRSMVIFTGGKDGRIRQWDTTLSPIGNAIDLHAFQHENHAKMLENVRISSLDYCFTQNRFVVGTRGGEIVQVWETQRPPSTLKQSSVTSVSASVANGLELQKIAASLHQNMKTPSLATTGGTGVNSVGLHSIAFAPEESEFVTCGSDLFVRSWSLRKRELLRSCKLLFEPLSLAISSTSIRLDQSEIAGGHGTLVGVGGSDGSISLLELRSLQRPLLSIRNTSSAVTSMRFSRKAATNELLLAVACANGLIYLYEVLRSEVKETLKLRRFALLKAIPDYIPHPSVRTDMLSSIWSMDFSSDGRFLRSQHHHIVSCWDLHGGRGRASQVSDQVFMHIVDWQSYTTLVNEFGAMSRRAKHSVCAVDVSQNKKWIAFLYEDGVIGVGHYLCGFQQESTLLQRETPRAHSTRHDKSRMRIMGGFALHDSILLTAGCQEADGIVCQWRIVEEDCDEQPRHWNKSIRHNAAVHVEGVELLPMNASPPPWRKRSPPNQKISPNALSVDLKVDWIFGVNVDISAPFLSTSSNRLVYSSGPVVIVYDLTRHQQRFFLGHSHRIKCLAVHENYNVVASASCEGRVNVWLVDTLETIYEFEAVPPDTTSRCEVLGLAFGVRSLISADQGNHSRLFDNGDKLLAVITKESSGPSVSVAFYNWQRGFVLARSEISCLPFQFGFFCTVASSFASTQAFPSLQFVCGGVDHVVFWHLDFHGSNCQLRRHDGVFGRHAVATTNCCAMFIDPFVVTGTINGEILLWDGCYACLTLNAAEETAHTEQRRVVALETIESTNTLVCALQGGRIVTWRYKSDQKRITVKPHEFLTKLSVIDISQVKSAVMSEGTEPKEEDVKTRKELNISNLVVFREMDMLAVLSDGQLVPLRLNADTAGCNQSSITRQVSFYCGELNKLRGMCCHPKRQVLATCGESGRVCIYDLDSHTMLGCRKLSTGAKAIALNGHGHLAVALINGQIAILDDESLEAITSFGGSALCVRAKYSPKGNILALVCTDGTIRTWQAKGTASPASYEAVHVLDYRQALGERSGSLVTLDFSIDGQLLLSSDPTSGKRAIWDLANKSETTLPLQESISMERSAKWSSWSTWCAGPTEGLHEFCHPREIFVTALDRTRYLSNDHTGEDTSKCAPRSFAFGTENGAVLVANYPALLGEGTRLDYREYQNLHCDSIEAIEFSALNQFVASASYTNALNGSNSSMVVLWKVDQKC